jgi:hypothetical protein
MATTNGYQEGMKKLRKNISEFLLIKENKKEA